MEKAEIYRGAQFTIQTRDTSWKTWFAWAEIGAQPPGPKIIADLSSFNDGSLKQYPTENEAIRAARANAQRVINDFLEGCRHSLIVPVFGPDGEETNESQCTECGERFVRG